ncbi:MAG: CoA-binding protein [Bacteroidetes bacterium]|nr:MAG: CoA-binding protein [Bacteroidota bacterium]MBL1145463.1 CoA-binding protein [Bacteroidota bacterium]NOG58261.1 CoA-binding protein [Bacteroidota bacterium]
MNSKRTLILGATTNSSRYAYMAANKLVDHGHEIVLIGIKKGEVAGVPIQNKLEKQNNIDTITMYLGPKNQVEYYDFILVTKPKRVIFNPGTWNPELIEKLEAKNIEAIDACTLVMLAANTY